MPLLRRSKLSKSFLTLVACVGIVTVGNVPSVKGSGHRSGENVKFIDRSMGHKSTSEELVDNKLHDVNSGAAADMPQASATEFKLNEKDKILEDNLLRKRDGESELKNPHPHISVPQLPFCKPTKTTVGSGGTQKSEEKDSKRRDHTEEDSFGSAADYDDDDVEVVHTSDSILDTNGKFLVATLDGKVTLLNKTGHHLWSVKTGPLFSSTISSLQVKHHCIDCNNTNTA